MLATNIMSCDVTMPSACLTNHLPIFGNALTVCIVIPWCDYCSCLTSQVTAPEMHFWGFLIIPCYFVIALCKVCYTVLLCCVMGMGMKERRYNLVGVWEWDFALSIPLWLWLDLHLKGNKPGMGMGPVLCWKCTVY